MNNHSRNKKIHKALRTRIGPMIYKIKVICLRVNNHQRRMKVTD